MIGAICCDNFGTLRGRIDILGAKVVKIYEIGKKIANLCYFNGQQIVLHSGMNAAYIDVIYSFLIKNVRFTCVCRKILLILHANLDKLQIL